MRKLAILAISFSAAIFLANYIQSPIILLFAAAFAAAAVLVTALAKKIEREKKIAVLVSFSLGFLLFFIYRGFTVAKADGQNGCIENCVALAEDYCEEYESSDRVLVTIQGGELKGFRCYLYDSHGALRTVSPGDVVQFRALFQSVSEEEDSFDSYSSSGIFLKARLASKPFLLSHRNTLRTISAKLRRAVSNNCRALFPKDSSAFFTALLVGDKRELYNEGNAYNVMSKAGIIHVVAISGMHVSFFVGLILFLFGNTRKVALICIPLMWAFVFVTGCSYSAVRAALMQTFLLMGPLFKRENDVLTSLFASLVLILVRNPFAAKSVSLQLSFAATAGICLFHNAFSSLTDNDSKTGFLSKFKKYLVGIFATSISSMAFTVPLCGIHFGFVSLISPITNLLSLWAVTICFYLGVLGAVIYAVFPIAGVFVGHIASVFSNHILGVCGLLSELKFSCLYFTGLLSVLPVVLIYICVILCVFSDFRPWSKAGISVSFSVACLFAFFIFQDISKQIPDGILTILDVGQGACASVYSHGRTVVVDCGSDSYDADAAEKLLTQLRSDGIDKIDALCLTHYHEDHMNGLYDLHDSGKVSAFVFPGIGIPSDDPDLNRLIEDQICRKYFVYENSELTVGDILVNLYLPFSEASDDNENCMSVFVSNGTYHALITGDSPAELELELTDFSELSETNVLIAGHHGSNTSSNEKFVQFVSPDCAVISVGENYYGHPSTETLSNFTQIGATIFRTDINGNIIFFFYS